MYPDSLHEAPPTDACAAFIKESRMELASATKTNRKSGFTAVNACFCSQRSQDGAEQTERGDRGQMGRVFGIAVPGRDVEVETIL